MFCADRPMLRTNRLKLREEFIELRKVSGESEKGGVLTLLQIGLDGACDRDHRPSKRRTCGGNAMTISDVQVIGGPPVLATPAEVDALAARLWITFPAG